MTYSVRLEPVGVDMEVEEGETVLHAAFRQGLTVADVKRRYPFLKEPEIRHSERYELSLDEPIGRAA